MAAVGAVALAVGVIGTAESTGGAAVWLAAVAVVGGLLVAGSRAGAGMLREARVLAAGTPRSLELMSWPYRTIRSPVNNRLLVTLDVPGSHERAPLAEFTAMWHSPEGAGTPARPASTYGSLSVGRTVFAIDDAGRCYLGRITRSRMPDDVD
jgi:hypothetical protein